MIEKTFLRNFRCHSEMTVEMAPGMNLFLGPNGRGKTSLVEALYVLSTGRSFRTNRRPELIRHQEVMADVAVKKAGHVLQIKITAQDRKFLFDKKPVPQPLLDDWYQCVVFLAQDILMVKGPSSSRRTFLDLLILQCQPDSFPILDKYRKAVKSRNVLLKKGRMGGEELDSWTEELVVCAHEMRALRKTWFDKLKPLALAAYQRIAGVGEVLDLQYEDTSGDDLRKTLDRLSAEERRLGQTLAGPHRDDFVLTLNGHPASAFASEGQKRSIILALRLAHYDLMHSVFGREPLVVVDDVMGELDEKRQVEMMTLWHQMPQVLLTTTRITWPTEGLPPNRLHKWE